MTYPTGMRNDNRAQSEVSGGPMEAGAPVELTEQQKLVLDALQASALGLTLRQIASSAGCAPEQLQGAVDALVERGLACRLNTIIPSYSPRYPGIRLYAD
jgi:DNA-binding MarR family transcriptional regulator